MSPRPKLNPRLGALIRTQRLEAGLSLRGLAARSGVNYSTLSRIEDGQAASPDASKLRAIALALDIDPQDLYALAGYSVSQGLPTFAPYLRSKYDLSDQAIDELESYFNMLRKRYGFTEGHDESIG